jgi:hypothetical protein
LLTTATTTGGMGDCQVHLMIDDTKVRFCMIFPTSPVDFWKKAVGVGIKR